MSTFLLNWKLTLYPDNNEEPKDSCKECSQYKATIYSMATYAKHSLSLENCLPIIFIRNNS